MLSVGGDPEPALDIITYVACTDAGVTLYKPTDKDPRDNSKLLNAEGGQFTYTLFICAIFIKLIRCIPIRISQRGILSPRRWKGISQLHH